MMKVYAALWLVVVAVGFMTAGCAESYTEKRVIREGPVVEQREVVR
jgi:hypothetical protein